MATSSVRASTLASAAEVAALSFSSCSNAATSAASAPMRHASESASCRAVADAAAVASAWLPGATRPADSAAARASKCALVACGTVLAPSCRSRLLPEDCRLTGVAPPGGVDGPPLRLDRCLRSYNTSAAAAARRGEPARLLGADASLEWRSEPGHPRAGGASQAKCIWETMHTHDARTWW